MQSMYELEHNKFDTIKCVYIFLICPVFKKKKYFGNLGTLLFQLTGDGRNLALEDFGI